MHKWLAVNWSTRWNLYATFIHLIKRDKILAFLPLPYPLSKRFFKTCNPNKASDRNQTIGKYNKTKKSRVSCKASFTLDSGSPSLKKTLSRAWLKPNIQDIYLILLNTWHPTLKFLEIKNKMEIPTPLQRYFTYLYNQRVTSAAWPLVLKFRRHSKAEK